MSPILQNHYVLVYNKAKGADLRTAIADKPWRMREFALRTVDGHRITIGHLLGKDE